MSVVIGMINDWVSEWHVIKGGGGEVQCNEGDTGLLRGGGQVKISDNWNSFQHYEFLLEPTFVNPLCC